MSEWLPCFHINASGGGEADAGELIEAEKERKRRQEVAGIPEGHSADLPHSLIVYGGRWGSAHCGGASLEDGSVWTKFGNEPVTSHYRRITG